MLSITCINLNPSLLLTLIKERKKYLQEKGRELKGKRPVTENIFSAPVMPVTGIFLPEQNEGKESLKDLAKKIQQLTIGGIEEKNGIIFFKGTLAVEEDEGLKKYIIIFPCGVNRNSRGTESFVLEEYFLQAKKMLDDWKTSGVELKAEENLRKDSSDDFFMEARSFKVSGLLLDQNSWQIHEEIWKKTRPPLK